MKKYIKLGVYSMLLTGYLNVSAQVGGGDVDGDPDADTSIPIDGGISLLIVSGISYGVFKLSKKNK